VIPHDRATQLRQDLDRFRLAVHDQLRKDKDAEVALAMLNADVRRAADRLADFLKANPGTTVTRYIDGRRVG
jgi:hypothetical protein